MSFPCKIHEIVFGLFSVAVSVVLDSICSLTCCGLPCQTKLFLYPLDSSRMLLWQREQRKRLSRKVPFPKKMYFKI